MIKTYSRMIIKAVIIPLAIIMATILIGMVSLLIVKSGYESTVTRNIPAVVQKPIVKTDNRICIVLDAGHGGKDNGARYNNILEKELNLDIVYRLYKMIDKKKYRVILTRTNDTFIPLNTRTAMANNAGADLFVSVHQNSLDDYTHINGIETWYWEKDNGKSKRLAACIQNGLLKATGAANLGLKNHEPFRVNKNTTMPAVLAEMGYLTQKKERRKLIKKEYRQKLAVGIFNGINDYLK